MRRDLWWLNATWEQKQKCYDRKKQHRLSLKKQAFQLLGGHCKCGFSDERALQLDHINGGGTQERRGKKKWDSVYGYYLFIIREPEAAKLKFQLLCANCNWIKRYEANELGASKSGI